MSFPVLNPMWKAVACRLQTCFPIHNVYQLEWGRIVHITNLSSYKERVGISNHRHLDCLLNCLFRRRKHQSPASLAFVRGIHRWPVDSHHKGPVTLRLMTSSWHHDSCWCASYVCQQALTSHAINHIALKAVSIRSFLDNEWWKVTSSENISGHNFLNKTFFVVLGLEIVHIHFHFFIMKLCSRYTRGPVMPSYELCRLLNSSLLDKMSAIS